VKRRSFLVGCGVCGGAALVGIRGFVGYSDDYQDLHNFSARQGDILAALVDAMLPPDAERGEVGGHVRAIDGFVTGLPAQDREQLGQCLYALEHGTLPLGGQAWRFSALAREDRAEVLYARQTASVGLLRLGFRSLKALVFLAYYRLPAAWAAVGYSGPVRPEAPAELRARYAALLAPPGAKP
jgi:hypothetical protein